MQDKKIYCLGCQKKRMCKNVKYERDVHGKPRIHGSCKNCGCQCYQYVKMDHKHSMGHNRRMDHKHSMGRHKMLNKSRVRFSV